jgi:MinD superfamily P-loop ATPase
VVTSPQELALADVRRAVHFLRRLDARILGLVENMSGLQCPHCRRHFDLFTQGGGEALARQEGIPFLGAIPLDPDMVEAADRGIPAMELHGNSAAKAAFIDLADAVLLAASLTGRVG